MNGYAIENQDYFFHHFAIYRGVICTFAESSFSRQYKCITAMPAVLSKFVEDLAKFGAQWYASIYAVCCLCADRQFWQPKPFHAESNLTA